MAVNTDNFERITDEPANIRKSIKLSADHIQAKTQLMNVCTIAIFVGTCIGGIYGLIWLIREAFGG